MSIYVLTIMYSEYLFLYRTDFVLNKGVFSTHEKAVAAAKQIEKENFSDNSTFSFTVEPFQLDVVVLK